MTGRPGLRRLSQVEFSVAQWLLAIGMTFELLALVVGILGALNPGQDGWISVWLAALALATLVVRAMSEHFGGAANGILRRLDLADGLGRRIPPMDEIDLIDDAPALVRWVAGRKPDEPYFASGAPPGPTRLVENLRESAWWTKRLSGDMATAMLASMVVLIVVGVITLVATFGGVLGSDAVSRSGTWVSPLILFVIGMSPARAWHKYSVLQSQAKKTQARADHLLERGDISEVEGLETATDYHLARQGSPVVPTLWYDLRKGHLNRLWNEMVEEEKER